MCHWPVDGTREHLPPDRIVQKQHLTVDHDAVFISLSFFHHRRCKLRPAGQYDC